MNHQIFERILCFKPSQGGWSMLAWECDIQMKALSDSIPKGWLSFDSSLWKGQLDDLSSRPQQSPFKGWNMLVSWPLFSLDSSLRGTIRRTKRDVMSSQMIKPIKHWSQQIFWIWTRSVLTDWSVVIVNLIILNVFILIGSRQSLERTQEFWWNQTNDV